LKNDKKKVERRKFLCDTGKALAGLGVIVGGGNLLAKGGNEEAAATGDTTSFPTPEYEGTRLRSPHPSTTGQSIAGPTELMPPNVLAVCVALRPVKQRMT